MYEKLIAEVGERDYISALNSIKEMRPKANDWGELTSELENAKETIDHLSAINSQCDTRINTLLDILAEQQRELGKLKKVSYGGR